MKSIITAKLNISNIEGEQNNEYRVCTINYSNSERGSFNDFVDNLCNQVEGFITKINNANELRIRDQYIVIKGYSIKFLRDDETVVDEVNISNETVNEVDRLLTAFCCC